MPLPGNLTVVPVHGKWTNLDGTAASGTVRFVPTLDPLVDPGADTVVLGTPIVATLNGTGEITVSLPATDDPDINHQPFAYRVEVHTTAERHSYNISAPAATVGTLELADVTQVVPPLTPAPDALALHNADESAHGGIESDPIVFTLPAFWNGEAATNAIAISTNTFRSMPVVIPFRTTISKARIRVQTQAGNVSVAVYTADGQTRLLTTGSVACPASGKAELTFAAPVTLDAGLYYVGMSASSASASFHGITFTEHRGASEVAGHPAPATITPDNGVGFTQPVIGLF